MSVEENIKLISPNTQNSQVPRQPLLKEGEGGMLSGKSLG